MNDVVEETIRLARVRAEASNDDGEGLALVEPADVDLDWSPADRALIDYLQGLPTPELQRLQTLMYFGRGDSDDLLALHLQVHGDDDAVDPQELVLSMVEKAPLAEYLQRGVELAAHQDVDLSAWWRGLVHAQPLSFVSWPPYVGPTFSLPMPVSDDPIHNGPRIFRELADKWSGKIIPASDAPAFFNALEGRTGGLIIVDFIDLGSWDKIVGHEFDQGTNTLTLYWHDLRTSPHDSAHMMLAGDLYGLQLHLQDIQIVRGPDIAIFLLRGFAITPNEARKQLRTDADKIDVEQESLFSTRVIRRVNGAIHHIDVHSAPLYTIALAPKGRSTPPGLCRELLFKANLRTLTGRLMAVIKSVDDSVTDDDFLREKGNTARRILEQALKIHAIYSRCDSFDKPYGQLQLSDLTGKLWPHMPPSIRQLLSRAAEWANDLSHDSGRPANGERVRALAQRIYVYVTALGLAIEGRSTIGELVSP